jgi:predicted RNA-binding protein with PUA domain
MFRKVVEGKWKLEKDNTVLVVTKNENPIAYDIVKISEEEIGLVHQKFEGVITYVRTKPER